VRFLEPSWLGDFGGGDWDSVSSTVDTSHQRMFRSFYRCTATANRFLLPSLLSLLLLSLPGSSYRC
jgi:hypothetical protein